MTTYKIEHRDVRQIAVVTDDGIAIKEFGYNTIRGSSLAEKKAKSLVNQLRYKQRCIEACAIVENGKCPECGEKLRRNLSLAGWWQCAQLGAPRFRIRPNDPPCGWQIFTE